MFLSVKPNGPHGMHGHVSQGLLTLCGRPFPKRRPRRRRSAVGACPLLPRCRSKAFTFETKPYDSRHLAIISLVTAVSQELASSLRIRTGKSEGSQRHMSPIFRRDLESILAFLISRHRFAASLWL